MFDNLREQANSSPFYEEEAQFQPAASTTTAATPQRRSSSSNRILGMTAAQRFLISVMFMFMVCILGALVLVITGKFGV